MHDFKIDEIMQNKFGNVKLNPYLCIVRKKGGIVMNDMVNNFIECAEAAAYAIVCKMIDSGYIESEPEGLEWEHEIVKIMRNKFGC